MDCWPRPPLKRGLDSSSAEVHGLKDVLWCVHIAGTSGLSRGWERFGGVRTVVDSGGINWWLHAVKTDHPKLMQKKTQTASINIATVPESISSLAS